MTFQKAYDNDELLQCLYYNIKRRRIIREHEKSLLTIQIIIQLPFF